MHKHITQEWCKDVSFHRYDGPAVKYMNEIQEWFIRGQFHRVDGPAVIESDGTMRWYLNDVEYTFSDWCGLLNLSEVDRMYYKIRYQING